MPFPAALVSYEIFSNLKNFLNMFSWAYANATCERTLPWHIEYIKLSDMTKCVFACWLDYTRLNLLDTKSLFCMNSTMWKCVLKHIYKFVDKEKKEKKKGIIYLFVYECVIYLNVHSVNWICIQNMHSKV